MTLLHSITGSLSRSRSAPEPSHWPAGTRHTPDDVVVQGRSLAAAARTEGTPLVRIGEVPTRPGDAGRQRFVTILVTLVEHVDHLGAFQRPHVWVDAAMSGCEPVASATRIIGRASTPTHRVLCLHSEKEPGTRLELRLPTDIRTGDLLAIACLGTVPRSHVAARHAPLPSADDPEEGSGHYGLCGK